MVQFHPGGPFYGFVVQLAETIDLKSVKYGFESHRSYHLNLDFNRNTMSKPNIPVQYEMKEVYRVEYLREVDDVHTLWIMKQFEDFQSLKDALTFFNEQDKATLIKYYTTADILLSK